MPEDTKIPKNIAKTNVKELTAYVLFWEFYVNYVSKKKFFFLNVLIPANVQAHQSTCHVNDWATGKGRRIRRRRSEPRVGLKTTPHNHNRRIQRYPQEAREA